MSSHLLKGPKTTWEDDEPSGRELGHPCFTL
jgi:hypothetical protein